jgi:4-oxalocrotonate tautomerase
MPLVRIDLLEGTSEKYRAQVGEILYRTLVDVLNVPENDRFQVITEHRKASLPFDRGYLGIHRSDDCIVFQITLNSGRSTELKQRFYQALADRLHEGIKIRKEDVLINLVEVPKENWSFGNGEAQYVAPPVAPPAHAPSQPALLQAVFARDAGTLSDKFTGLARVMSGKYDWKPGQDARSVGDVFNLIVKENDLLAGVLSGATNTGAEPAPITDPEKMQDALQASYVDLQKVITGLPDNDLPAPARLFGRDMTKQGALTLIFNDQHEHLGQSIAYARSNGVVPPWSR